jgi:hypothetical protein
VAKDRAPPVPDRVARHPPAATVARNSPLAGAETTPERRGLGPAAGQATWCREGQPTTARLAGPTQYNRAGVTALEPAARLSGTAVQSPRSEASLPPGDSPNLP